jgi:2-methylisocitrate lyase-like PEP mutase family enzyme
MNTGARTSAAHTFRALHQAGCFLLPNPWDVGSALYLQHLGFEALATTSAGFAFTRGLPDAVDAVTRDMMLTHIRDLVAATSLPVNADFQAGFADDPDAVAENVRLCVETGVGGLSIEDATRKPSAPLYEQRLAVSRIRAARRAIDATGVPVVLTARCEAFLVGDADPLRTSLERLALFAEAGADCLYAPGVTDLGAITAIVKAVAPKPVNVLVSAPKPELTREKLAAVGVRRISVGGALARVAWGAFMRAAQEMASAGTFERLGEGASMRELNQLFENAAGRR